MKKEGRKRDRQRKREKEINTASPHLVKDIFLFWAARNNKAPCSSIISRRGAGDVLKYEVSNKPFIFFFTIAQLT